MGEGLYRPLSAILLAHGCEFERQGKGSHEIWVSPISGKRISVPFSIESRHTANSILKKAGIDQKL
ncbi:type II toxin-antitoxin system HicA family toxin [Lelliottia wanjuensis]|uniref:type II toxin-antitoxin system HicA family toxin n=1 Tax=Lelliottia wanjuensis TaxID=3050585 RepID=UPI00254E1FD6|nr:type II toxin-antitoxin system HicA family toxin [Lelliottia sp. V104_15]MDK9607128.1 type II toxin-antitoxin system HicA family toxin [Lelliottia sp. V104_15]